MVNPLKTAKEQLLEQPKDDIVEEENSLRETVIEEGLRLMFQTEDIEMRSDASKPLILAMSRGDIYVDRFKSDVMAKFMKRVLVRSVSNGRKGRSELVALVRNAQDGFEENTDLSSAFAKVLGK